MSDAFFELDGEGLRVARITYEFLRPVPIAPLTLASRIVRPGRRVQLVEAELRAEGEPVVRASALRIRSAEGTAPAVGDGGALPPPPGPEASEPVAVHFPIERPWFGADGVEVRFAHGAFGEMGPATAWFRLRTPVVAGEEPSALQRAACAADFGNGISSTLDWGKYLFINADLTVYLERPPLGEWVCLEARTTIDPGGTGLAQSVLRDERGPLGRALQTLYVDRT